MAHRAKDIIDAIKTVLTGLNTTGQDVKVSRAFPSGTFPNLTIYPGQNTIRQNLSNAIMIRELVVRVAIQVNGNPDLLDDQILQIEAEIWRAIMADTTLGLNFIDDIDPLGLGEPDLSNGDEVPTAVVESSWRVVYRHSVSDPES